MSRCPQDVDWRLTGSGWLPDARLPRSLVDPFVPIDFFVVCKKGRQKTALAAKLIHALGEHFREIAKEVSA